MFQAVKCQSLRKCSEQNGSCQNSTGNTVKAPELAGSTLMASERLLARASVCLCLQSAVRANGSTALCGSLKAQRNPFSSLFSGHSLLLGWLPLSRSSVSASWAACKAPQTGGLNYRNSFLQLWRPEVPGQGVSRVVLPLIPEGESIQASPVAAGSSSAGGA